MSIFASSEALSDDSYRVEQGVQVRFLSALFSKQSIKAERNLLGLFSFLPGVSRDFGGHFDFRTPNDSIRFGCLDLCFGALTPSQTLPAS